MISITQMLPNTCPNKHGIIDKSGVGVVEKTSSKNSDFAKQNVFDGVATLCVVSANWMVARILRGWHENSGQPNCPTTWD